MPCYDYELSGKQSTGYFEMFEPSGGECTSFCILREISIWWKWIRNILEKNEPNDSQFNQIKMLQAIYNFSGCVLSSFNGAMTTANWAGGKTVGENDINIKYSREQQIVTRIFFLSLAHSLSIVIFVSYFVVFCHRLRRGNFAPNYYLCMYHFIYARET